MRNCWSWHWTHIACISTDFTYQQIEGQDGVVKNGFEQEAGIIIFGFIPQTVQFLVFTPVRRQQLWLLITAFGLMVYVREMRRAEETGLNKLYKWLKKNHILFYFGSMWHNFLLPLHMPLLEPYWITAIRIKRCAHSIHLFSRNHYGGWESSVHCTLKRHMQIKKMNWKIKCRINLKNNFCIKMQKWSLQTQHRQKNAQQGGNITIRMFQGHNRRCFWKVSGGSKEKYYKRSWYLTTLRYEFPPSAFFLWKWHMK